MKLRIEHIIGMCAIVFLPACMFRPSICAVNTFSSTPTNCYTSTMQYIYGTNCSCQSVKVYLNDDVIDVSDLAAGDYSKPIYFQRDKDSDVLLLSETITLKTNGQSFDFSGTNVLFNRYRSMRRYVVDIQTLEIYPYKLLP